MDDARDASTRPTPSSAGGPLFRGADFGIPDAVACPFCDGTETELHAAFGSALSVVTYWCRRCRTAFEWMKR